MKRQVLFPLKDKSKIIKVSSAAILLGFLMVKRLSKHCRPGSNCSSATNPGSPMDYVRVSKDSVPGLNLAGG